MNSDRKCYLCRRPATAGDLCLKCNHRLNRMVESGISDTSDNSVPCPRCDGSGKILTKVPTRNGHRYGRLTLIDGEVGCPLCHGKKRLKESLPLPDELKVVPSDVGITKKKGAWRPMSKIGGINGLPSFSGKAIATDGILVAIRRDDGKTVLGHLSSFVEIKPANNAAKAKRMSQFDRLAAEFA